MDCICCLYCYGCLIELLPVNLLTILAKKP